MTLAETLFLGISVTQARQILAGLLREDGIETSDLDARLLICAALGINRTSLVSQPDRILSAADAHAVRALARRRLRREPVARILGYKEFFDLEIRLSPATLVPRPETETIVNAAFEALRGRWKYITQIADLGTGSGAILLALLHELPHVVGVGTDRSTEAIVTARANADLLDFSDRAMFVVCDFSSALNGPFDLLVSNPPYIASEDIQHLQVDVRDHDPRLALDGGPDGLAAYRAIAADAPRLLAPDGALVVELGAGQLDAVLDIMANAGLTPLAPARADLAGIPRALTLAVPS